MTSEGIIELVVYTINGNLNPLLNMLLVFGICIIATVVLPNHIEIVRYYPSNLNLKRSIPMAICTIIRTTKHIPKYLRHKLIPKKARPKKRKHKKPTVYMDIGDDKELTHTPFKEVL